MKYKKMLTLAMCSVLSMGVLAGCGSGSNTSDASKPSETPGQTAAKEDGKKGKVVKLKFWGGVPAESGPQAVMDDWNSKNPDIQVEYVRYVNDDAGNLKLDTALITGQNADIYVSYTVPALKKRIDAGVASNLSARSDYNIDEKMGPDAKDWKVNDKYYGMPTKKNMSFIWLNKDMLDAAGLSIPAIDWTWDDLRTYAAKLKKDKVWGYLQHESGSMMQFDGVLSGADFLKQDGTSDFKNPLVQKGFETYYAMMTQDKSIPSYGEQITSKMPTDTMFLKGESAMLGAGEFIFRNAANKKDYPRDFKIAFATIPKVDKNQADYKYPGGVGDFVSINEKSANKEAAWKFLTWYADGGMMPMASGGRIPSSSAVNSDDAVKLMLNGMEDSYDQESLKNVVFGNFATAQINLSKQVVDARKEELEKYFLGKQDIQTALDNLVKSHNELISKQK